MYVYYHSIDLQYTVGITHFLTNIPVLFNLNLKEKFITSPTESACLGKEHYYGIPNTDTLTIHNKKTV